MLVLWPDEGQFVVALTSIFFPLSCLLSTLSLSAKQFRDLLARKYGVDSGLAMIIKQRAKANEIDRMDLVGNVQGSDCILGEYMLSFYFVLFCLLFPLGVAFSAIFIGNLDSLSILTLSHEFLIVSLIYSLICSFPPSL